MEIQKTNRYGQFSLSDLNREVNETHVRELMTSISEANLLEFSPIIVNREMEVIDGQHRLEAAKRLKLDIYYVVSNSATIKETRLLNRANKSWQLLDFVKSYAFSGNKEAQILAQLIETYNLQVTVAMDLARAGITNKDKCDTKALRRGQILIGDIIEIHKIGEQMMKLQKYVNSTKPLKSRTLLRAIKHLSDVNVNFDTLIEKLDESGWKINPTPNYRDMLRQFEDIYNYKIKNRVRIA